LFFDAGDGIELTTPQQLHEFQEIPRQLKPESSPCIAAYSADGTRSLERVEFGPKFQGWRLDDAATGAIVAEIPCAHIGKWGMCFTRDSRRFALASYDQFVRIGDARDGKIEYFLRTGKRNMGVEFSRDGDLLAVCHDHDATVWSRRRPEYWWGVAWLPEFWLTVVFAVAFVWSVWRDRHELGRMAKTRA
jgi:WD40 repeat protein